MGEARDRDFPLEILFDGFDQTLADCYGEILDPESGELDEALSWDGYFSNGSDLLVIEKVEVLPKYRGKGIGLKILRKTLETFKDGKAAAVLEAHPLRQASDYTPSWSKKMQLEQWKGKTDSGIRKLRKHWGKLGFKQVRKTHFFLLDLAVLDF
jgi:GNAT superfamily N-acetyltransferase